MPNTDTTEVDVRGPRFAAWITTAVLVAVLLLAEFSPLGAAALLAAQALVFALGAGLGPRRHPYGLLFARLVRRGWVRSPSGSRCRRCASHSWSDWCSP